MVAEIESARRDGDTLGGVVEVLAYGLPPGLGSHVHWDRRLDSRLAAALMGIQAVKGVSWVTASPRRAGVAPRRTTRSSVGATVGFGGCPRERVAPRAACPPASRCGCARR
jgi:hypothetical protein